MPRARPIYRQRYSRNNVFGLSNSLRTDKKPSYTNQFVGKHNFFFNMIFQGAIENYHFVIMCYGIFSNSNFFGFRLIFV